MEIISKKFGGNVCKKQSVGQRGNLMHPCRFVTAGTVGNTRTKDEDDGVFGCCSNSRSIAEEDIIGRLPRCCRQEALPKATITLISA